MSSEFDTILQNITKYATVSERAAQLIKAEVAKLATCGVTPETLLQQMLTGGVILPQSPGNMSSVPVTTAPDANWLAQCKKHIKDLLSIEEWPEAYPGYKPAEVTKENHVHRANMVLDWMLDRSIEGLDFLDFGCGDGWVARQALVNRKVASATGYDIKENPNWANIEGVKFTKNFKDLKPGGYDVIMLYDVVDHVEPILEMVEQVKSLLKLGGKSVIYVRCHPWTSKHATHVYKQGLNKAFIHLFLTWGEIAELLPDDEQPMFTRPEKTPIDAYRWWFHEFSIKEKILPEEKAPLHPLFQQPEFKELIIQEQKLDPKKTDQFFQEMQIEFVDYILEEK